MTPVQIAYFKHFLFDRGIQAIYISKYRNYRIKGNPDGSSANPESLEQFLQEQPPFRVLTHAFYFQPGSNYGYDYWKEISKKWLKYLEMQEDNPQNDKVIVLKGSFAILRQNWDNHQYWKTETMEATYARMHMEPPLNDVNIEEALYVPRAQNPGDNWVAETKHKFKVGDIIQGTISGDVITVVAVKSDGYETNDDGFIEFDKEQYWDKIDEVATEEEEKIKEFDSESVADKKFKVDFSGVPEAEENKSSSESLLEGFSLVEASNPYGGKGMGTNLVSVNMRNGGYRVTFSAKQSTKLRKAGYKYVKLLTKKDTGEIAFVFNDSNGCKVSINESSRRNVTINSKEIAEHIKKFYGIKYPIDYFTLKITDTIQQDLNTIYKLKLSE